MDIEINNNKQQASFKNGKFYHTFTPSTANQTVKLYHMGCVGDTRLNRIQLEQGTEPTGFVEPKATTNTISGIFKNLRDLDVKMTDPDSDLWTRIKKTARGTVEEYHTNTIKNEIVKTAEGIIEKQTKVINTSVENKITAETKKYSDELSSRITTLSNNALRKDEISITPNGVTLGSGKVIDGRTITSLITTQPENIKAITDKFIITPANENLVLPEYRRNSSFKDDMQISEKFDIGKTKNFLIKGKARTNSYENRFRFATKIIYKDGTNYYITGIDGNKYINGGEFSIPFKIYENEKEIENVYFTIDRHGTPIFDELSIVPQKSAELIVDGTIEGKHIKSSTIETGHLKAGSVTSEIISSNAIKSKHLQVDDAMIDKIIGNQAFVTKLWAKDAFINNLNAIKITAEDLSGKVISSPQISGGTISSSTKFILGNNGYMRPIDSGLQIFTENSNALSSGVILQLHGYEKIISSSQTIPRGLYLYNEKNFNEKSGDTFLTYETLLTVDGMIKIRGFARGAEYGFFGAAIPTLNFPLIGGSDIGSSSFAAICRLSLETIIGGRDYLIVETPTNTYRVPTAQNSDIRLKENLKETKVKALDYIEKIKFKSFDWKDKTLGEEKLGVIAQELEKIEPSFVSKLGDIGGKEGHYVLELSTLCIYSLKSIQELSTQNNELQQRITKLEELING